MGVCEGRRNSTQPLDVTGKVYGINLPKGVRCSNSLFSVFQLGVCVDSARVKTEAKHRRKGVGRGGTFLCDLTMVRR